MNISDRIIRWDSDRIFEISGPSEFRQGISLEAVQRSVRGADIWNIRPRIFEISDLSFAANYSDRIIRCVRPDYPVQVFQKIFQKEGNGHIWERAIYTFPLPSAQGACSIPKRPNTIAKPSKLQNSKIFHSSQSIELKLGESKEKTPIYIFTEAICISPSFTWGPLALRVS